MTLTITPTWVTTTSWDQLLPIKVKINYITFFCRYKNVFSLKLFCGYSKIFDGVTTF